MKKSHIFSVLIYAFSLQVKAQVSVGWDAACDYDLNSDSNGLQQAIDDGATEVRLSHSQVHQTTLEITNTMILKGGYVDCAQANLNNQTNINSVIDGTGVDRPAVKVRSISNAQVILDGLTLQNGTGLNDGLTSNWAGGLSLDQVSGTVNLNNVYLKDNAGINGGGLSVINFNTTGSLLVTVNNMTIENNISSGNGGGLFCYAPETGFDLHIDMGSAATIRNNHSDSLGGGLYVDGCSVEFKAGISTFVNSNIDKEIFANSSNLSGAGIFASGGAVIDLIGGQADGFDVFLNQANLDTNASAAGGGIHASSQNTAVNLVNAIVSGNSTGRYGGGLYATFDALITMGKATNGCQYNAYCSQLINNNNTGLFPGGGGAMAARFSGQLNVNNTLIQFNNSNHDGYVVYSNPDGLVVLEGNLITENGNGIDFDNDTAFYQSGDSLLTAAYNTIIQNNTQSTIFRQNSNTSTLNLFGNIIKEFGNIHQDNSSISDINCNLINDLSSISVPMNQVLEGEAAFLDSSNMDYRLAESDTLAIDVCDSIIYAPGNDLQGRPRGVDHPMVVNDLGLYDLGAYEYDDNDLIFKNNFE